MSAPRTTVVTGGTGALGRHVVHAFLAEGDRVVVPWIDAGERDTLAAAEGAALSDGRLVLVEADVAEPAGGPALLAAAGVAHVLVNAVGGFAGGESVLDTPLDVWERMARLNLRTALVASRALLPGMLAQGRGAVVSIASRAAFARPAGLGAYAAAKMAIVVLTETLDREVGARGVRVNAVAPGTLDTPANRRAMPDADRSTWTAPADVARVIVWLAGPGAAAVHGAVIPV